VGQQFLSLLHSPVDLEREDKLARLKSWLAFA
jgi:hypothetical protein